jgi:hypothetical protein
MEKWLRGRHDAELDRAHQLRRADLFGETSAEAIAALARDVSIRVLLEAERLPLAGTVVIVIEGAARITPADRRLEAGDTAGALEALAGERQRRRAHGARTHGAGVRPRRHARGASDEPPPPWCGPLLRKLGVRLRHLNTHRH